MGGARILSRMTADRDLMLRWIEGDEAAGRELVERHYDSVVRFFRNKARAEAEDLVQRTFLALTRGKARYRGEATVRAFVFGIARNILLEQIRTRVKASNIAPEFSVKSLHELNPGPSTVVRGRSDQRLLASALQRIPVELQMTIELYYWEELSVAELACVLVIPAGTVKSRLHRGREILREALESMPAQPDDLRSVRSLFERWAGGIRAQLPD